MNATQTIVFLSGILTLWPAVVLWGWVVHPQATWRTGVPLTLFYLALAAGWYWVF
jgi:hypothetical protein